MNGRIAVPALLAVAVLTLTQPALAGGLRCEVTDPEGDALWQLSNDNKDVPPYQDIVQIEATKVGHGVLTFAMDLAGEVPEHPSFLLPSVSLMIWTWTIDTDPETAPAGYPLAPGVSHPEEFLVRLIWDGGSFRADLVDRRPLLTEESAIVRPASFTISKSTISVSVEAEALGDPAGSDIAPAEPFLSRIFRGRS